MMIFFGISEHTVRGMAAYAEFLILWWAFIYMTVKSRIWWAFLMGTATEYRELSFLPDGRSGYSPISMWSISVTFVHIAEMKAPFPGSENCDFRVCI